MSLLKYFCNDIDSNKESVVALASSANALLPAKRRKTTLKRRKWNDDYLNYGFLRPIGEENSYPSAQCLFCSTIYGNVRSKLLSHLTKQHPEHQNKSKEFFQSHLAAQKSQSDLFDKQMGRQVIYDKNILLASLKMSHHMMKVKLPYTELQRVVLPCLEIAVDLIHGGKKQVIKSNKFRFPTLLLDDVVLLYPKI